MCVTQNMVALVYFCLIEQSGTSLTFFARHANSAKNKKNPGNPYLCMLHRYEFILPFENAGKDMHQSCGHQNKY
jgi:hypothetical protein